ncbi:MAG: nitroreductase family protein [Methanomicrobiaceae archaeon]|nr:nitroreductase family protein [Methanomicrobiaceae archaeon]
MDSSEFLRFLLTRSSVREYSGEQPEEKEIAYLLSCASLAPSAGNRESWDVVVVRDRSIRENLADAAYGQEHLEDAPVLMVVCANYVRAMSRYGERGILYAVQDATIAATYMMLAGHAEGLHSCWTGAFEEDAVREVLSLPDHIRPVVLLAVGKGRLPPSRTPRNPVEEHVHHNSW